MNRRVAVIIALAAVALLVLIWAVWPGPERVADRAAAEEPAPPTPTPAPRQRVTLLYPGGDGLLHPALVELALPDEPAARIGLVVQRLLDEPPGGRPLAVPYDARLLDVFVSENGTAFIDLSGPDRELEGTSTELMLVYSVVNSVLLNAPMVHRVQLLFDGHEVDTLTGHLDLSRPLSLNKRLIGS